jgi:hypothetical protein
MKKIIISLIAGISIVSAAQAATLSSQNANTFQMNETRTLWPVTITASANGEITAQNGINLFMEDDVKMLWDDAQELTATGTAVGNERMGGTVTPAYQNNYKIVHIPVSADFLAGESVTINGLRLRAYRYSFSARYLQMDTTGDLSADVHDVNGVEVQNTYATDFTPPYPPADVSATLSSDSKKVTLNWINPPDYDLIGCSVDRTRIRNGITQQVTLMDSKTDAAYTDTDIQDGDTVTYSVFCGDGANFSDKTEKTVEVKSAPLPPAEQPSGDTSGQSAGQQSDELSRLTDLYSYYKIRYQIKCFPSGIPAAESSSVCLWARIDLAYAQEKLNKSDVNVSLSGRDIELMALRVRYPEARYRDNCVNAQNPANYCSALSKSLDRTHYFIEK